MKNLIKVTAAMGLMTFLTACGLKDIIPPPKPEITGAYAAEFSAKTYIPPLEAGEKEQEFCFGGSIKRLGGGFWEMKLDSPETLAGMELTASDDGFTCSLDGLLTDIGRENMPQGSPVSAMLDALDEMAVRFDSGAALAPGDKGGYSYNSEGAAAVFDDGGAIVSLALSEPRMTVDFTGFTTDTARAETAVPETLPPPTEASETVTTVIFPENSGTME